MNQYHCPAKLNGVCKAGPREVVVCMENQSLQFVHVGDEIVLIRSLSFDHMTLNVACGKAT